MPHPESGTVNSSQIRIQLSCYDLIYICEYYCYNKSFSANFYIFIDQGTYRISTVAMCTYRSLGKIQHEKFLLDAKHDKN